MSGPNEGGVVQDFLVEPELNLQAKERPCAHCGLPVQGATEEIVFCCSGCQIVHEALSASGLQDTYYALRALDKDAAAQAVIPEQGKLQLTQWDMPGFLEQHTEARSDGTRSGTFLLEGVHCAGCVWVVEQMPFIVTGVIQARLNLLKGIVSLTWDPTLTNLSSLVQWLRQFGYRLTTRDQNAGKVDSTERKLLKKVGVTWALAGNIMLLATTGYGGLDPTKHPGLWYGAQWLSFLLASATMIYGGSVFIRNAWTSIRQAIQLKSVQMLHLDLPIAIGILSAFLYSFWGTLNGTEHIWFDSIAVLIAALITARWLQARSLRWAREQTGRHLEVIPKIIRTVSSEGIRALKEAHHVQVGDLVEVLPGEVVPVDGQVIKGYSNLNKAAWSGESHPVSISEGEAVEAGCINLSSALVIKSRTESDGTRLEHIIRAAQEDQSKENNHAGYWGAYFTFGLLLVASVVAVSWLYVDASRALPNVVALLVIACPCALSLSKPLTRAVAIGRLARKGIHIKNPDALEGVDLADIVVFDKTGTLTSGKLKLVHFYGEKDALGLAAAAEQGINHPVAWALIEAVPYQPGQALKTEGRRVFHGHGVVARLTGTDVAVGRPDWIVSEYGPLPGELEKMLKQETEKGRIPVAIAIDQKPVALAIFGDTLRSESKALTRHFASADVALEILSGDHPTIVTQVAHALDLAPSNAYGHQTPEAKHQHIEALVHEGKHVLMIGDGINDAAAMQTASTSIALSGALSPGLAAADVYIARNNLKGVQQFVHAAQLSTHRTRLALSISLLYNLGGAMLAAIGLIHPLVAAIAMPISSLLIVALATWPYRPFSSSNVIKK